MKTSLLSTILLVLTLTARAESLGTIYRDNRMEPAEPKAGWYEYTFNPGPGSAGPGKLIFLKGFSDYGWDIYLDDISVINPAQSVEDNSDAAFFSVYPNPATGNLFIGLRSASPEKQTTVSVYGIMGETFINRDFQGGAQHEISLDGLVPGIYFVRVTAGGQTGTAKIVKN